MILARWFHVVPPQEKMLLETIPNHVVNWVQVEPNKWKQLMNHYQELGDHIMEAIT
jgi:hypothetical protein